MGRTQGPKSAPKEEGTTDQHRERGNSKAVKPQPPPARHSFPFGASAKVLRLRPEFAAVPVQMIERIALMKSMSTLCCLCVAFLFLQTNAYCGDIHQPWGEQPTMKASEQLEQADQTFNNHQFAKARQGYLKVVELGRQEKNDSILVEGYSMIARTWLSACKYKEGIPWLEKAAALAKPEDSKGWSRYLGVKGRFQWQNKEEDKAVLTFKDMYEYCSNHELHSRAIDAAHMLAIVGDLDQKIEWSLKTIKEAEKGEEIGWLAPLWNNLGWNYDDKKEYDKALDALVKAREYHYKNTLELPKLIADWSVGHAYRMVGKRAEAEKILVKCLSWAERLVAEKQFGTEANEWVGFSCKELAELAMDNKEPQKAKILFQRAIKELTTAKMQEWDAKGFEEIKKQLKGL